MKLMIRFLVFPFNLFVLWVLVSFCRSLKTSKRSRGMASHKNLLATFSWQYIVLCGYTEKNPQLIGVLCSWREPLLNAVWEDTTLSSNNLWKGQQVRGTKRSWILLQNTRFTPSKQCLLFGPKGLHGMLSERWWWFVAPVYSQGLFYTHST